MATTTTSTSTSTSTLRPRKSFANIRALRRPRLAASTSTPDLNAAFSAHSRLAGALSRKTSLAALNATTLASIPDVSETYALDSVLSHDDNMIPATPGRPGAGGDDVVVGDTVEVPGGMQGTVRFVGAVQGKKGQFVGIELSREFAPRGKNNGDVDGISYFNTNVPGAGIFVPITKALRRDSPNHAAYPSTPGPNLRVPGQSTGYTPPTPALPKLSASVGPGARAPSPQAKQRPPRMSLPRPESPVRRTQMTPAPRPSMPSPSKAARQASPTNRFAQSVRGTAGDPNKKIGRLDQSLNLGQRSTSAMGGAGGVMDFDDDPAPLAHRPGRQPGLTTSASAFNLRRPASRANNANEEEIERLRAQLEDRDSQLKDQASTLAEMESSLIELQSLIDQSDGAGPKHMRNSMDDKDSAHLRMLLREKTDKIAMLTAEFDAHRADFRSTIDTLELASTETERVYEKRMEELMADIRELESRNLDVDSVANQLKQLEELVQELEEGLEDARRGEVEARGEAEFLRGEVERTRSELRRERDKSGSPGGTTNGGSDSLSKELEQKEDEIRGLKAIIHSLSRDSVPGEDELTPTLRDSFNDQAATNGGGRSPLERRVAELQALLDKKSTREEELEQEVEHLRRGDQHQQHNNAHNHRSSLRDSRDTVIPVRAEPRSPDTATHRRGNTLDTMPESDTYSSETSALWCEICETSGHDILTCTNMFGSEGARSISNAGGAGDRDTLKAPVSSSLPYTNGDETARPAPLRSKASSQALSAPPQPPPQPPAAIKVMPNPMESGPVAGKESGIMDPEKWCAVCERDGHDSVDCPFEDAF